MLKLYISLLIAMGRLASGTQQVGCFSSLPSSFSSGSTNEYQSSGACAQKCSGSQYFALYNHNECFCGNENPSGSVSKSDSCNAYCFGYRQEMCGGTDAYLVYAMGSVSSVSSSGSGSGSASGSSTADESSSLSSSESTSVESGTDSGTSFSSGSGSGSGSGSSSSSSSSLSSSSSSSSSSSPTTTSSPITTASPSASDQEPSVVYSTSIKTVSGSVQFVTTNVVTASAAPGNTDTGKGSSSHGSKKKTNVGAIVGGVVGGVVGLLLIILAVVFAIRHISRRRENERMEKEYQEAIKPVEYNAQKENYYASSFSDHMHTGDSGHSGHSNPSLSGDGNVFQPHHTPMVDDMGHVTPMTGGGTVTPLGGEGEGEGDILPTGAPGGPTGTPPTGGVPGSGPAGAGMAMSVPPGISDPFADPRRFSNGSLLDPSLNQGERNKLTIVNPDE